MKWLLTYLTSSIGKKQVMGATGCLLLLFVLGHMVGNLQLLYPDPAEAQAAYNTYSALLTKSKLFLYTIEGGLAVIFIIHVYLAVTLKLQNYKARGAAGYVVNARKGRKQFPTFIMIWTGLAIVAFVTWHILTVRNGIHYLYINPEVAGGRVVRDMWLTTVEVLGNPLFAVFYISTMLILGFHLWHAISSAFQTMGINHQKWTPIIDKLAILYCVVVACGFGATAVGSFAVVNMDEKAKAIMEQAKNPSYQKALEILKQQPLDEQKKKAHIISKFPERANLIVESIMEKRGLFGGEKNEEFMKFKEKHKKGKKQRLNDEGPQSEEDSEGDDL
ncbi:MAG: succinate dehydrogenase cytochrome b subunit [Fibromonadaceae bacterium]|jgi:succinate dehydrogenase / fumarate reductase cytochrome b subunit|nr:succinate dehydrogenase cytochrome b subunit [Fibromonadaceae bacterium]